MVTIQLKRGARGEDGAFATLPNIVGQRYTIGSTYPGANVRGEFLFADRDKLVDARHCHIDVDSEGQYWIEAATVYSGVFINNKQIKKERLLKIGDIISLRTPMKFRKVPVFLVAEKSPDELYNEHELLESSPEIIHKGNTETIVPSDFLPGDNPLILSVIFCHLKISDLKNCRFVSNTWNREACKLIEKGGMVVLNIGCKYTYPRHTMEIFRYLKFGKDLKVRKLNLTVDGPLKRVQNPESESEDDGPGLTVRSSVLTGKGKPGHKMFDDIEKLVKSDHNFTTLEYYQGIENEADFKMFHMVLSNFRSLEKLDANMDIWFLPETLPLLDFKCLKIFQHSEVWGSRTTDEQVLKRWAAYIVPFFAESLESFKTLGRLVGFYLHEFPKHNMAKLSKFVCKKVSAENAVLLSQSNFLLSWLELEEVEILPSNVSAFQNMIEKHAPNLRVLKLEISSETLAELKFPVFPKLKTFSFMYDVNLRVKWGNSDRVSYAHYFPALEKLKIWPNDSRWHYHRHLSYFQGYIPASFKKLMKAWVKEIETVGNVFTAFFPFEGAEVYETVLRLEIPPFCDEKYKKRFLKITEMFPKAFTMDRIQQFLSVEGFPESDDDSGEESP